MLSNSPRNFGCRIIYENGDLVVLTPYIPLLVQSIKSLPTSERRYDAIRKAWLIDPKHGQEIADWIEAYAGEKVFPPSLQPGVTPKKITRILQIRYLGGCKEREDGSISAFGLVGSDWSAIFPESVLVAWFEGIDQEPTNVKPEFNVPLTYYSILGIKKTADTDQIKTGFRRMALQWHPDHCKEPNAAEQFIQIKTAYDCLIDPGKKARYDVGLKLQAKSDAQQRWTEKAVIHYRTPLRCGLVLVEGIEKLGRIEVSKIHAWEDITHNGKTLVTSWPMGAKEPVEIWA